MEKLKLWGLRAREKERSGVEGADEGRRHLCHVHDVNALAGHDGKFPEGADRAAVTAVLP